MFPKFSHANKANDGIKFSIIVSRILANKTAFIEEMQLLFLFMSNCIILLQLIFSPYSKIKLSLSTFCTIRYSTFSKSI